MIARRVSALAGPPEETGVVLIAHGQPESRAKRDPEFDEGEAVFLNRVKQGLVEGGLPEHNVRLAWAEWREPDVTSAVRHLAALHCTRVCVVPATYPLDTLSTRLDLEQAVRQARVEQGVSTVTVPAWGDDPAVVDELARRVRETVEGARA
jgi:protoheme ferro-lyase